jgi:hypothetical protein
MEQHIEWTSPATLWDGFNGPTNTSQRRVFRTPAILRFADDDFMQQFVNVVNSDPRRVSDFLAVPETWRKPPAEAVVPRPKGGLAGTLDRARTAAVRKLEARQGIMRTTSWNDAPAEQPLKLYHPSNQRYYLVTACLVCRTLGLPDRTLDTTKQEKAAFVIRLLQPLPGAADVNPDPAHCTELALIGNEWKPVSDAKSLLEGETEYPLTPLSYTEIDGRRRRMFNGLIPVAKREALLGAKMPNPDATPAAAPVDARRMMLKTQVVGPWASLEDVAKSAQQQTSVVDPSTQDQRDARDLNKQSAIDRSNDQIQTISWYILLDLDDWLSENLHEVWTAIGAQSPAGLTGTKLAAYNALAGLKDTVNNVFLTAALKSIRDERIPLENVKGVFKSSSPADWPSLRFQFVQASQFAPAGLVGTALRDSFETTLVAALDVQLPGIVAAPSAAAAQASASLHRAAWFAVRCVFERPNCTAFSPPLVSDATASFQLAAFFDPDAPARPIRIAMPTDTTPAGLRKFDKNTAFVMSDVLCGQVSALRGVSFVDLILSVLPFPLHKDLGADQKPCTDGGGVEIGMVCSFSIPIITICALILLMIFIKLFDIIFFWMPFFQLCLPVPKFNGKGGD